MDKNRKNCIGCEHYYITWDKNHPKGCKGFGFKSVKMPCDVVFESSGKTCQIFSPRKREKI